MLLILLDDLDVLERSGFFLYLFLYLFISFFLLLSQLLILLDDLDVLEKWVRQYFSDVKLFDVPREVNAWGVSRFRSFHFDLDFSFFFDF